MDQERTVVTAEIVAGYVSYDEACRLVGFGPELLERCLDLGLVVPAPAVEGQTPLLSDQAIERLRSAVRLHRDLGIPWTSLPVVLELLDRIEELERDLADLRARYGL